MKHAVTADIHVPIGKKANISLVDEKPWFIPFKPLGKRIDREPESIEAIEYISKFSKGELFLFQEVCKQVDDDCTLTLRPGTYSSADRAKLKRAIPLWKKKELLVSIKREHYMVNPWFLVPPKHKQFKAMTLWRLRNPQIPTTSSSF
jgi:hypothetical protein